MYMATMSVKSDLLVVRVRVGVRVVVRVGVGVGVGVEVGVLTRVRPDRT